MSTLEKALRRYIDAVHAADDAGDALIEAVRDVVDVEEDDTDADTIVATVEDPLLPYRVRIELEERVRRLEARA